MIQAAQLEIGPLREQVDPQPAIGEEAVLAQLGVDMSGRRLSDQDATLGVVRNGIRPYGRRYGAARPRLLYVPGREQGLFSGVGARC